MEIDSNWFLQLVVAINVGNGKTKSVDPLWIL